jgi:pyruvate, water dikinase
MDTPLAELADALQRFRHGGVEESDLSAATQTALRAALVRRFLTDQLEFVNTAKEYLTVADFHELCQHIVYPPRSHGRLGGKAAGLFLAAKVVLRSPEYRDVLGEIRTPRSWHIPSDGILDFIHHNDLEDVYARKYTDPDRVRLDYPYIVQLFKNSFFSADILRGLSDVLDDLDGRPIIVRSSSLLEDRLGAAFSGKYKSLFLANTGTSASGWPPSPTRSPRSTPRSSAPTRSSTGRCGGCSTCTRRWASSSRRWWAPGWGRTGCPRSPGWGSRTTSSGGRPGSQREDGLLRMVPGLGTRAVDRLADDYPVLIAPGQPGLRINQTPHEARRYSPKKADVVNLETGVFETVDLRDLLERHGDEMPLVRQMISIADHDRLRRPAGLVDFSKDTVVLTFEGLVAETPFVARMRALLQVLREKLKTPVDIEFASDGRHVYLLQCRPQGATEGASPVPIPRDLPQDRVLFTARRYVSNGQVNDVSHVVYVDPDAYARLEPGKIREVGRAVGRLNRLLPKRQFILMGPGGGAARGDIRLGVPVTYADISNAAVLVEIARKKGGYLPDLSFGTHFFQDLVESNIRYLPLYPDDPDVVFNEAFFLRAENALASLAPEFEGLADALRVIDVPRAAEGRVLRILMNGDLDEAVGLPAPPPSAGEAPPRRAPPPGPARTTTGAGGCAWPSGSRPSSTPPASG